MNLLFDFRSFQEFYGRGVGRYVYELFTRVIKKNDGINAVLISPDRLMPEFKEDISNKIQLYSVEDFEKNKVTTAFDIFLNGSTVWLNLPGINTVDVLYPEAVLSRTKLKTCILHDFCPLFYEHYIPDLRQQANYILQCQAVKCMDHVFTNSEYVRETGSKYLERPLKDFTSLYGGADMAVFKSDRTGKRYSRDGRTHDLVNVSGFCPRKNFESVTKAFCVAYTEGLIPEDARLVFICEARNDFVEIVGNAVQEYGLRLGEQVVISDFIPDKEMVGIISSATCSIFPSLYEGLGLPILESYSVGTPCITANTTSMKELAPREALFDPFDIDDIKNSIVHAYKDDALMEKSLEFGQQLLKKINWDNSADIMYQKLLQLV